MSPLIEFIHLTCEAHANYKIQVFAKNRKWRPLWLVIDHLLETLSGGKNVSFYRKCTTTIGPYIFFPAGWESKYADLSDCVTLQHEVEHVKQFRRCGLGNAWLGVPVFGLLYLLFPLPAGFAWFRYAMERAAYKTSIKAWKHYGVNVALDYYTDTLSGPTYLWPWPKEKVRAWFKKHCA
jgi:hypothetical protein